jgi:predicted alpha-1,6-mannanase (GH76 family)
MKLILNQSLAVKSSWRIRAVWIVVLGFTVSCGALTARAFTSADADTLLEAHTKAFYRVTNNGAWFMKSTEGGKADYWTWAEQMEMVLDAYERNTNTQQLVMFTNLFHGFLAEHGKTWEKNPYNDDIMWMVIACTRAHLLTGNREFLDVAQTNFDLCYARAASTNLGGGLWWKVDVRSKNACVNGPGSIAAFLLGKATGEGNYFTIATNLFLWERATLFDATTGKISDNINADGRLATFALTYNQGTFVGAANFLGYTNEARLAALYTMNHLGRDGFLPPGGENGDGGGFNGIGVRWIAKFMYDRGEQATFEPWLQKNAEAAWQARRASDNLSNGRWPQPTPPGTRYSWGCSSAVVITQVVRPSEPDKLEKSK